MLHKKQIIISFQNFSHLKFKNKKFNTTSFLN